jgi:Holliday junction DNA helicase RuvB
LVEEFLYPVMEDFKINIILDKEPETIDIPAFTLVGATTSGGSLSQPFYDRFQIKEHLSFYSDEDLVKLARLNCDKLGISISDQDLLQVAKRSKGTPRILNARLKWFKNYKTCNPYETNVEKIFDLQGIDNKGLDMYDRMYLDLLKKNKGNPLGLKAISAMTGIAMETIENSIEPYLVRKGFIVRTQKGRIIA